MLRLSPAASVALVAGLRGEPRAAPAADDELAARARDGDARATALLEERRQEARGRELAAAALARELVTVELDDGAWLSLDEAEQRLARREERGAHRPLRAALERALDLVRQFSDDRIEPGSRGERAQAFLAGSADLALAALSALESVGGARARDDAELTRLLDLPGELWRRERALALLSTARAAAGVELKSVRVPRLLTGVVLEGAPVRVGVFEGPWRSARLLSAVQGGAVALALQAGLDERRGRAVGLGLLTPPASRIAGLGREEGERLARVGTADRLLRARYAAARALFGWPEALERALPARVRPALALRELLEGGAGAPPDPLDDELGAAAAALRLRDSFDEAFAVSAGCFRGEGPLEGEEPPVLAWQRWCGDWL